MPTSTGPSSCFSRALCLWKSSSLAPSGAFASQPTLCRSPCVFLSQATCSSTLSWWPCVFCLNIHFLTCFPTTCWFIVGRSWHLFYWMFSFLFSWSRDYSSRWATLWPALYVGRLDQSSRESKCSLLRFPGKEKLILPKGKRLSLRLQRA